jgi:hypothetical protein
MQCSYYANAEGEKKREEGLLAYSGAISAKMKGWNVVHNPVSTDDEEKPV